MRVGGGGVCLQIERIRVDKEEERPVSLTGRRIDFDLRRST